MRDTGKANSRRRIRQRNLDKTALLRGWGSKPTDSRRRTLNSRYRSSGLRREENITKRNSCHGRRHPSTADNSKGNVRKDCSGSKCHRQRWSQKSEGDKDFSCMSNRIFRECDGCGTSSSLDSTSPVGTGATRSEEHTSELQSRSDLVCRLLLEKK